MAELTLTQPPQTVSLEDKAGPWLMNLDLRRVPTTQVTEGIPGPRLSVQLMWFPLNTCSPSRSLESADVPRSQLHCSNSMLGVRSVCGTPWGGGSGSTTWSPPDSPHAPLPSVGPGLPLFAVSNQSHEFRDS